MVLVPVAPGANVKAVVSPAIYCQKFCVSFGLRQVFFAKLSLVISASTKPSLQVIGVCSLFSIETVKPVVKPQVISKVTFCICSVQARKANSEKPTMIVSENKNAKKNRRSILPQSNILRILAHDKYIRDHRSNKYTYQVYSPKGVLSFFERKIVPFNNHLKRKYI